MTCGKVIRVSTVHQLSDMPTTLLQRQEYRTRLRRNATPSELRFRERLQKAKVKHCFQEIIGPFIVDFWFPRKMLIIEIDGSFHDSDEQKAYDIKRDEFFLKRKITTIRIRNNEVDDWPVETIRQMPEPKPRGVHIRRIERLMRRREKANTKKKCTCGSWALLFNGKLGPHLMSGKGERCPLGMA